MPGNELNWALLSGRSQEVANKNSITDSENTKVSVNLCPLYIILRSESRVCKAMEAFPELIPQTTMNGSSQGLEKEGVQVGQ